jgi:hypothetical protein
LMCLFACLSLAAMERDLQLLPKFSIVPTF